jgi:copper(I)-binding protein
VDGRTVGSYITDMTRIAILIGTAVSLLASPLGTGSAAAEDYSVGSLQIGSPWARATPRGANVAAAYLTITNKGSAVDRLVGGSTTASGRFEVHDMVMEGGVAKMRPVEGGLAIKPGDTVELKPGSFHIMLMGLKQPLLQGTRLKGTLVFEQAGKVDVEFAVQPIGQSTPPQDSGHQHQH